VIASADTNLSQTATYLNQAHRPIHEAASTNTNVPLLAATQTEFFHN